MTPVSRFIIALKKMADVSRSEEVSAVFSRAYKRLGALQRGDMSEETRNDNMNAVISSVCEFVETNSMVLGVAGEADTVELEVFAEYLKYFLTPGDYPNLAAGVVSRYSIWFINKFAHETGTRLYLNDLFTEAFATHENIMRYCHTWGLTVTFSLQDGFYNYTLHDPFGAPIKTPEEPVYEVQVMLEHVLNNITEYIWKMDDTEPDDEVPQPERSLYVNALSVVLNANPALDLTSPDIGDVFEAFNQVLKHKKYVPAGTTTNDRLVLVSYGPNDIVEERTFVDALVVGYSLGVNVLPNTPVEYDRITLACANTVNDPEGRSSGVQVTISGGLIPAMQYAVTNVLSSTESGD